MLRLPFFVLVQSRAVVVTELLREMNEEVLGTAVEDVSSARLVWSFLQRPRSAALLSSSTGCTRLPL